ncbi:MAG TPA: NADH-quinone oxidoreductase subunit NuoK [Candidatus Acidoferrum sp.]|jgi:NADH-quinone oxidoreductase subunit K|nr:NADH-quinone oxidoreductase subunit NuoK [Candidatus Acidoferrum sp.]
MLPVTHYLFLSSALFFIGLTGVVTRRNLVVKLFSMEIILNAASINFMAFARLYGEASGQVFAMLTVGVLALELLVALVIVAAVCSRWKSERPDDDKYLSSQVDY